MSDTTTPGGMLSRVVMDGEDFYRYLRAGFDAGYRKGFADAIHEIGVPHSWDGKRRAAGDAFIAEARTQTACEVLRGYPPGAEAEADDTQPNPVVGDGIEAESGGGSATNTEGQQ